MADDTATSYLRQRVARSREDLAEAHDLLEQCESLVERMEQYLREAGWLKEAE